MTTAWTNESSPFHQGEQAIQQRLGVRDKLEKLGRRMIRDHMPDQHRAFFEQLPLIIIGSVDQAGRPWASAMAGQPGFISTPDDRKLNIAGRPIAGDPLNDTLLAGTEVGLLGIDFQQRRRNRLNGQVQSTSKSGFEINVAQTFGNCPAYIQTREYTFRETGIGTDAVSSSIRLKSLSQKDRNMIETADTFFIATHYSGEAGKPSAGVDVSHRGGKPGFVRIDDDNILTWPEFSGNNHFNTLGNLLLNPRAGLLFIDFDSGDLLYLTGTTSIIWNGQDVETFEGAERLVQFKLEEMIRIEGAFPLQWSFKGYSRSLERTGSWATKQSTS